MDDGFFAGLQSNDDEELVRLACAAYTSKRTWTACVEAGARALGELYDAQRNFDRLRGALATKRRRDWTSRVLWSQSCRATEHTAKYLELKAAYRRLQADVRAWADVEDR